MMQTIETLLVTWTLTLPPIHRTNIESPIRGDDKMRQCHTRQYIEINQKAMASTYETTTREPGVMMSRINQAVHQIKPQSVTTLLVCQFCCSIQTEPPFDLVIRLT